MTSLFGGGRPRLDDPLTAGYATAGDYLVDLVALARDWFARAAIVTRLRASAHDTVASMDGSLAAIDARIVERTRWLAARAAASSTSLPPSELAHRLGLDDGALQIVFALVAAELDASLVHALGTPAVDATSLYAAFGWPDVALPDWLRAYLGTDSLLITTGAVRFEAAPGLPLARRPLALAQPLLTRVTGVALRDELVAGIVSPLASDEDVAPASELVTALHHGGRGISLWITGTGKRLELAAAVARADHRTAVVVDVVALARDVPPRGRAAIVDELAVEQRLDDRAIVLRVDGPIEPDGARALRLAIAHLPGPCILVSADEQPALGVLVGGARRFAFPRLDADQRYDEWQRRLGAPGRALGEPALMQLASDFPLDAIEIDDVASSVSRSGAPLAIEHLRAVAQSRQRSRLGRLAQFVPPGFAWRDLVLPDDEIARLREIVARQQHRGLVFDRWNMGSKVPYGTGTAALFTGPPGTGKTMAASVVARAIGRELYRIDLSRVVDKYIGETEKNLAAIFDAAVDANAILLFDEADSLFAKRTTVGSSHDRYANLETNFLLQRIEEHPGISILTTNNAQSIDPAFARRIQFRVDFPFPDARARAEIWRRCLTPEIPSSPNLDFPALGDSFELSGANIKAAVLRAAFAVATTSVPLTTQALAEAARREFENAGKLPPVFRR